MDDNHRRPDDEKKNRPKLPRNASLNGSNKIWILTVTILSFFISVILTAASSDVLKEAGIFTAFLVILVIILINIIFDTIGTAVTAAEEAPFHAMASKKLYGAKQAIRLIRNADKVSNVCNDVVGDICGIISGAAGAYIIFRLIGSSGNVTAVELIVTGMITALTVGGKALGKIIALQNSNYIIYKVGSIIHFLQNDVLFFRKRRKTENGRKKK
ncbi:MAG TPA: Mg2+ and Co2+ transporter CorB [Clostridiales bacterium]|nr:Mg2+ and Co2+ transporter CorB [Clostridiales bacterium]HPP35217.1 Mg2+ and Co2+ transporter CorB [Clostridiales bacterium]